MKILDSGHVFLLDDNKANTKTNKLIFYKDSKIHKSGHNGTTNQEVLRALISRVLYLDKQIPCDVNKEIIFHLRKALILHEIRHLNRLIEKSLPVENIEVQKSGHIVKCHKIKKEIK